MADSLTITGVNSQGAQVSAPAGSVVSAAAATAATAAAKPLTQDSNPGISPRIVIDPLAGVITEFLTSTGQVQSQIPSSAAVAYLRAGLDVDGQAKPTVAPPHPTQTAGQGTSDVLA